MPADISLDRPVFFVGVQGGGMTLIVRMLARNKKVMTSTGDHRHWFERDELAHQYERGLPRSLQAYFYFYEPYVRECPEILNGWRHCLPDDQLQRLPERMCHLRRTYGSYAWWNYASDELLPYFRKTAKDFDPDEAQQFKDFLRTAIFFGRPLFSKRSYRFVDKSQIFSVKVGLLNKIFEKETPIFIAMTRNPYAVCWRAATQGYLSNLEVGLEDRLKICTQHWRNTFTCITEDFEAIAPERRLLIRIEDFVQDPAEFLGLICEKTGLAFSSDMLPQPQHRMPWYAYDRDKWYPIKADINSAHLNALDERHARIIQEGCGALAQTFGYRYP